MRNLATFPERGRPARICSSGRDARAPEIALGVLAALLSASVGLAEPPAKVAEPLAQAAVAKPKASASEYLRLAKDKEGKPTGLEVAIARFAPANRRKTSPTVDLVGAIHVAEPSYYDRLNKEFAGYDVVLYELVAPEGARPPKGPGASTGSPISTLQTGMTRLLDLEFQLEGIDYERPNMVHADMSPEDFRRSMQERGESFGAIFLRAMGYAMAQQSKDPGGATDMRLLMAFFDKDRAGALKRVLAEQMIDMEGAMGAIEGKDGSTLISERNKRAIEVLRQQIGKGKKKIAIFYGAGHMPDMEKRLQDQFGLARRDVRWLVAWDLTAGGSGPKPPAAKPAVKTP